MVDVAAAEAEAEEGVELAAMLAWVVMRLRVELLLVEALLALEWMAAVYEVVVVVVLLAVEMLLTLLFAGQLLLIL